MIFIEIPYKLEQTTEIKHTNKKLYDLNKKKGEKIVDD